jgi:hypothetical protein
MTFLLESLVACAVFTVFVFLMSRDPIKSIFNYPPAIIKRCESLGLVDDSNRPGGPGFYAKKICALVIFGVLLGLLVRHVNGCTTFWGGALTAYALWCVVDWFDAFVLDCLWFCHDKHFVIPGTEDMARDYHDYWFHIKGGLIGMVLAIPAALIAGLTVVIPGI